MRHVRCLLVKYCAIDVEEVVYDNVEMVSRWLAPMFERRQFQIEIQA